MRITRELAKQDWVEFGLRTGVCFCTECGNIDRHDEFYNICPVCRKLNSYVKGATNGERY